MSENKRIENPKSHYKLEYDIKTNDDNLFDVLEKIQNIIREEFNNIEGEAEVMPTITKVDINEFYEWRKVRRGSND